MARHAPTHIGPPAVGINPHIPVPVQRDLRTLADASFAAQRTADGNTAQIAALQSNRIASLNALNGDVTVQGDGITIQVVPVGQKLIVSLAPAGPGAGTYVVGAKLTGGGVHGTITLDRYGRVVAVQQAT